MARTKNVKKVTKVGKGKGKKELVRRPAAPAKKTKPAKKTTGKLKKGDRLGLKGGKLQVHRPKKKTGAPKRPVRNPDPGSSPHLTHEAEAVAGFIVRFTDDGRMELRDQAMLAADCAVDLPDMDKAYVELVSDVFPIGHFEGGGERKAKPPGNETPPSYLNPGVALLSKLGSIIAHFVEADGLDGHDFDIAAARTLVQDPEVRHWFGLMDGAALIPKARKPDVLPGDHISTVTVAPAEERIGLGDGPLTPLLDGGTDGAPA